MAKRRHFHYQRGAQGLVNTVNALGKVGRRYTMLFTEEANAAIPMRKEELASRVTFGTTKFFGQCYWRREPT